MMLVAAAPATAQLVPQEFEQEDLESGDVEPSVDIANKGDNVNLCTAILQSANTGNVINEQGVSQYSSFPDDIEFEGSTISVTPEAAQECEQVFRQTAAAGAAPKAAPATPAPAPAAAAAAPASAPAAAAAAPAPAPAPAAKALPATGGTSPLLAVGAGAALLLGGGLLVRRIIK